MDHGGASYAHRMAFASGEVHDDVELFYGYGIGFGDEGAFDIACNGINLSINIVWCGYADFILTDTDVVRADPRLAGRDVVFPAVPSTRNAAAILS